ncbi:acyl-CoA Delta-9 desaturase-like [Schistocerca nitens]|uniref:acyl-CoA Delta-9 desaturase-like n=1 Tax=Schistocerca nitens TaxID=7011 RepID=UPI002118485B|nr:acyl-CoA Delta-9 desaturase-like [Schistocerca nitens]
MGATEMTSGEAASPADDGAGAGSVPGAAADSKTFVPYQPRIRWLDLIVQLFLHTGFLYGFWLTLTSAKLATTIWALVVVVTSGVGITAGAHRLWSHRAYKAKWPLRLLLVFLFTIAGQRHVYQWALDHRVHHKFSETDADPHDARRGFLFSHVGWLVLTPHPAVTENRAKVDMSDLEADPIVMWQKRLYVPLFALLVVVFPVWVPWYFWDETLWRSFFVLFNFRFVLTLNIAFLINSVAHMWGNRPYDKHISPVENAVVSVAALGEGWHNYHHVFPWDYKAAELGASPLNPTTAFIDFFARLGWAYDLKTVAPDMVRRRVERSGDGSHALWGWGDRDLPADEWRRMREAGTKRQ